jgi:probable rRNA maturation factor
MAESFLGQASSNPKGYEIAVAVDDEFATQVDSASLIAAIVETLRQAGVAEAALALAIAGDDEVRRLNHEFLGIDAATDVLSFVAEKLPEPDSSARREGGDTQPVHFVVPPELLAEVERHLGDIIIAYPYAARQAAQYGNSLLSELRLLAVHGTLHLLGYDHDTAEAEARMWVAQEAVLAVFGDRGLSERRYGT